MNHQNWTSLERVLDQLDRKSQRSGRRITPAALVLVAGLWLGYFLLSALIPPVWPALIGSDPGAILRGWPFFVWAGGEFCLEHPSQVRIGLVIVSVVVVVATYRIGLLRPLVWLSAVGVILIDAGILATTLLACLQASGLAL
jgi:hypothetical protein